MEVEYVENLIPAIVLLVLVSFFYFLAFKREIREQIKTAQYRRNVYNTLDQHTKIDTILSKTLPYYQNLDTAAKDRFVRRVNEFIYKVKFVPKEGFINTPSHEILIAATCVQLTFGLDRFLQHSIGNIVIYPNSFYSKWIEDWVDGLAVGNGNIFISWSAFEEGISNPTDKRNLGLHEMAHALKMASSESSYDFDIHFTFHISHWNEFVMICMEEADEYLREYGLTNEHEFFSSSVEYFFEAPEEMKEKMPRSFYMLCLLLNQDPSNKQGNYEVDFDLDHALAKFGININTTISSFFTHAYYIPIILGWFLCLVVTFIAIIIPEALFFYAMFFPSLILGMIITMGLSVLYDEMCWDYGRKIKFTVFAVLPIISSILCYLLFI